MNICIFGKPENFEALVASQDGTFDFDLAEHCRDWLPLPQEISLLPDEELYRISRHQVGQNFVLWLAVYRAAQAIGSSRHGAFYGAGLILQGEEAHGLGIPKYLSFLADKLQSAALETTSEIPKFVRKITEINNPTFDFDYALSALQLRRTTRSLEGSTRTSDGIFLLANEPDIGLQFGSALAAYYQDSRFTHVSSAYCSTSPRISALFQSNVDKTGIRATSLAGLTIRQVRPPSDLRHERKDALLLSRSSLRQPIANLGEDARRSSRPPTPSTAKSEDLKTPPPRSAFGENLAAAGQVRREVHTADLPRDEHRDAIAMELRSELAPIVARPGLHGWLTKLAETAVLFAACSAASAATVFLSADLILRHFKDRIVVSVTQPSLPMGSPMQPAMISPQNACSTPQSTPAAVVKRYFSALNSRNFQAAISQWNPGSISAGIRNLPNTFPAKYHSYSGSLFKQELDPDGSAYVLVEVSGSLAKGGNFSELGYVRLQCSSSAEWRIIKIKFGSDSLADTER